jgi:hypothetical protein
MVFPGCSRCSVYKIEIAPASENLRDSTEFGPSNPGECLAGWVTVDHVKCLGCVRQPERCSLAFRLSSYKRSRIMKPAKRDFDRQTSSRRCADKGDHSDPHERVAGILPFISAIKAPGEHREWQSRSARGGGIALGQVGASPPQEECLDRLRHLSISRSPFQVRAMVRPCAGSRAKISFALFHRCGLPRLRLV